MYRRRPYGGGGGSFGLVLLALQLMNLFSFISRSNEFFPVTLGVLGLNIAAYLQPGNVAWPSLKQACISVQGVWFQKQWKRLFFAPFIHSSDFHLYYNMASFMWKAISLERHFGTPYFLYMISVFSLGSSTLYVGINYLLAETLDQWSYVQSCAVGFSGVVFALKVVTTHMQPQGFSMVMGFIPVPMRLACWVELVLISVLFPNVSFVGHLAGILVGLAFVAGPLKTIMDLPLSLSTRRTGTGQATMTGYQGGRRSYTYRAESSGYRARGTHPAPDQGDSEEQELQGDSEEQELQGDSEEQELQAAVQQSRTDSDAGAIDHDEDRDLQRAIERSLVESDDATPPPLHADSVQRSPPYNPYFMSTGCPSVNVPVHNYNSGGDLHSTETALHPNSDARSDPVSSVRRRPVDSTSDDSGGVRERPSLRGGTSASQPLRDTLDTVREARLRKFGSIR